MIAWQVWAVASVMLVSAGLTLMSAALWPCRVAQSDACIGLRLLHGCQ